MTTKRLGLIMNGSTGWEHPIQYHPLYADYTKFFGMAGAHYSAQLFISDYPHGAAIDHWLGQEDLWRNDKVRDWSPWPALALRRGLTAKPAEEFIFPILAEGAADIKRAGGYVPAGAHGERSENPFVSFHRRREPPGTGVSRIISPSSRSESSSSNSARRRRLSSRSAMCVARSLPAACASRHASSL